MDALLGAGLALTFAGLCGACYFGGEIYLAWLKRRSDRG